MDEKTMNAIMEVTNGVYLPAFLKAAADKGVVLETEDDIKNAMETVAMLKLMGITPGPAGGDSEIGSAVVKQAKEDLSALWMDLYGNDVAKEQITQEALQNDRIKSAAEALASIIKENSDAGQEAGRN